MFAFNRIAFAAKAVAGGAVGQVLLLAGTTSWAVPAGVTSISMVCVQPGSSTSYAAAATSVTVAGTTVCRALNESRIGDGGGAGGAEPGTDGESINPGGGGAGGYGGPGGFGGGYSAFQVAPTAGSNGGGGGGYYTTNGQPGGKGGGVGVLGMGDDGAAAGAPGADGSPGSGGSGVTYGGGLGSSAFMRAGRGGALSYKNNVAVTPGQTVTVSIPNTYPGAGAGAIRIIWGAGRAYPATNTQDM